MVLEEIVTGLAAFVAIIVVLPIALWVVKRKGRSFWWLCLLLIPFGWIGVLFLRNQRELSGSVIRRDPKNLFLYVLASSLAVAFLIAMGVGFSPFWDDYKTANDELSLTPKVNFEGEKEGPRRQFPQQKDEPAKKEYDYPSAPLIK